MPTSPIASGELLFDPDTSYVYRAYDATGQLLYVGLTDNLPRRLNSHQAESHWYPYTARLVWEQHPNRRIAARVEAEYIKTLHPRYNSQFRVPPPPRESGTPSLTPAERLRAAYDMIMGGV